MTTRTDISATCVAPRCATTRRTVFRGQEAVYDDEGGAWRHADCRPCVPMRPCANCGGAYMGHLRTWTGDHCNAGTEDVYSGGEIFEHLAPGGEP